jgi:hypothetical protein
MSRVYWQRLRWPQRPLAAFTEAVGTGHDLPGASRHYSASVHQSRDNLCRAGLVFSRFVTEGNKLTRET